MKKLILLSIILVACNNKDKPAEINGHIELNDGNGAKKEIFFTNSVINKDMKLTNGDLLLMAEDVNEKAMSKCKNQLTYVPDNFSVWYNDSTSRYSTNLSFKAQNSYGVEVKGDIMLDYTKDKKAIDSTIMVNQY